jgi:myo-inositol-1(or 4)-monophosphatase
MINAGLTVRRIQLSPADCRRLDQVESEPNAPFTALTAMLGLDPSRSFRKRDLQGVSLAGDDLAGFDFSEADLASADLSGADLSKAKLTNANLEGAIVNERTRLPPDLSERFRGRMQTARPPEFPVERLQSPSAFRELLVIAEAAASAAGAALRSHRAATQRPSGRNRIPREADRRSEKLIAEVLRRSTPFPVVSESGEAQARHETGFAWVVDPLDGSLNFRRGDPYCAVSIALMHDERPLLGVIDCFILRERFSAIAGEGAWLNGTAIRVSDVDDYSAGILNTSVPERASGAAIRQFEQRLRFRKIRMIGSSAIALAYIAAGRAEAFYADTVMIWDVAAGCVLVEAAGGKYDIGPGAFGHPLEVKAANGRITLPV